MKQALKIIGLSVLLSAVSMAQVGSTEGTVPSSSSFDPVRTMWWIFTLLYGSFGAIIASAILWHSGHAAVGNHEGFGKILHVIYFGAIGFGVVYLISHMTMGAAAPL
jgi:hypothetical protein